MGGKRSIGEEGFGAAPPPPNNGVNFSSYNEVIPRASRSPKCLKQMCMCACMGWAGDVCGPSTLLSVQVCSHGKTTFVIGTSKLVSLPIYCHPAVLSSVPQELLKAKLQCNYHQSQHGRKVN